jgi:hypothetical protein
MRKLAQNALACVIALGVLLGAAAALILWTERLDGIASPFLHVLAVVAELAGGVPVLLGALYVATQTAVRMFAGGAETPEAASSSVE